MKNLFDNPTTKDADDDNVNYEIVAQKVRRNTATTSTLKTVHLVEIRYRLRNIKTNEITITPWICAERTEMMKFATTVISEANINPSSIKKH